MLDYYNLQNVVIFKGTEEARARMVEKRIIRKAHLTVGRERRNFLSCLKRNLMHMKQRTRKMGSSCSGRRSSKKGRGSFFWLPPLEN